MPNEQVLISGIEYKIRKLIDLNEALQDENYKLKREVSSLKQQFEEVTVRLQQAEDKLVKLSLANTLEYKFSVEKGKEKLDELISEIDRCINVLSD